MFFGEYQFLCCLENDAILPTFKGSTFRGVFGHALKKVVCALKRQECSDCLLNERCIYALVFETQTGKKPSIGSRIASIPHPFVIEPPDTKETAFLEGASFDFKLLLLGELNHSLPYFIYAIDQMGRIGIGKRINKKRSKFVLKAVKCDKRTIYSSKDQKLKTLFESSRLCLKETKGCSDGEFYIKFVLETPLRLKFKNRLKADLPFHVLARAMLRRVSSLLNCYGDGEPTLDYRGMVERAQAVSIKESNLEWFDWQRYSQRQDQAMLMGGLTGSIIYQGKIAEFMPLIDFCSKVHIGKQTTFGLGKVRAERLT